MRTARDDEDGQQGAPIEPIPLTLAKAAEAVDLDDPALYINRELSLLDFHRRVLQLSEDPSVPLLERVRFLAISSSILDEFFEIRVAGLKEQIALGLTKVGPDGLGPRGTLQLIRTSVLDLVRDQYRVLSEVLIPQLESESIKIYRHEDWDRAQAKWVKQYFRDEVLPVLTPVGLDPAHPFPRILNKSLNFIVSLSGKDSFGRRGGAAVVQAPRVLPRLIKLPDEISDVSHGFVLLSSVIHAHVGMLFPGMNIQGCDEFRVTRNSDLWVDEEEVQDLLLALKGELPRRHYGNAVRLELSHRCLPEMRDFLLDQFELEESDLFDVQGPVNLHRLEALYDLVDLPSLKYGTFIPGFAKKIKGNSDLFAVLRERDILLHHPYQSFVPVTDLLRQAAQDPDVLAIKQTVYRSGVDTPVGNALLEAARNGKEVTAVVELRARFDEAANIELASRLQEAGAKVVYGVVGYKTHSKMLMIVRREGKTLRRYVHLGTGNYNPATARMYTDFGFMTSDPEIGQDVHDVFQQLTGLGRGRGLQKLVQTPFELHEQLLGWIEREKQNALAGKKARIRAKMNSLIERKIIRALYEASQAGVKVDLVVRGTCCLRPGVAGVSENIRVRSVVGRFLEHHRIFYFEGDGEPVLMCGSADWMPRNFFRRVEVCFPVQGRKNRDRVVREGLQIYFQDNCHAWDMQADGSYLRGTPEGERFYSQEVLLSELAAFPT